jgi:dTDP-4-amino-4,6-dideoxygalactose transaminase
MEIKPPTMVLPMEQISDLALFGAKQAFDSPIHVGRPNIGERSQLMAMIEGVLDSGRLTNRGERVREFEALLAARLGVKNCVAMSNATVALEIVTRALGMTGEVIIPSMTFIATAHALQWQAVTPVFCDIDPHTHTLDVSQVEKMITPRTTGIIGVHLWGRSCDVIGLTELARKHDLKLVFDAAHALGCSYHGRKIGSFGDAEVFSFHATKVMNTFEGGAVATNDDELAEKVRLMQNFGFQGYDNVIHVGTNGKMNEVSAAMGISGLAALDGFIERNRVNYQRYRQVLGGQLGFRMVEYDEDETCNFHYIVFEVDPSVSPLSRDELIQVLHAENVLARRYFWPGCHRMEPYRSYFPHAGLLLPESEKVMDRLLVLPTGLSIDPEAADRISEIIRLACTQPEKVRARLVDASDRTTSYRR